MVLDELVGVIHEKVKPLGFRKRGKNFYRLTTEMYSIINLRKDRWDPDVFYVEFGFMSADRVPTGWLPAHKCHVQFSIESVLLVSRSDSRILHESASDRFNETDLRVALVEKIVIPVVGVLEAASGMQGLKQVLAYRVSGNVAMHHEMRTLLDGLEE